MPFKHTIVERMIRKTYIPVHLWLISLAFLPLPCSVLLPAVIPASISTSRTLHCPPITSL